MVIVVLENQNNGAAAGNQILTLFDRQHVRAGQHVRSGQHATNVNHYSVLHTVEAAFGLCQLGAAAAPITTVWK
ncbi:hypothetical protein JF66_10320 [Cryobacterium sp. MLB-32]|nr:hypothetical protein JF66_10320 [Cryobacterium sp. MLB-32]